MWAPAAASDTAHTNPGGACNNIRGVFEDINQKCCNGGAGTNAAGHRRTQADACKLDACTPACARVFVSTMGNCQTFLPAGGGGFTLYDIPGADAFLAKCQGVLTSAGADSKTQAPTGTQFIAADPVGKIAAAKADVFRHPCTLVYSV